MPESNDAAITLYFAPRTRSVTALWLLEEMQVPYRLESFDLATGRHKQADYLALNPMGKVPLVVDRGVAVAEIGAITVWLGARYPQAGLAPAIDDPQRAEYLRWVFFASGVIEPAYAERFLKIEPRPSTYAWGSFDQMLAVLTDAVQRGTFLLGDRFSAADVLIASAVRFGMMFGIVPKEGPLADYVGRVTAREAFARMDAIMQRENERFPPKKS
jgi:glutathione S-transferase